MTPTIKDVATQANVAVSTVSRVINNSGYVKAETRARVQRTIEAMGYSPNAVARSLSTNKTHQIGVIVPDITNPYFAHIIQAVSSVLDGMGYGMLIGDTHEDVEQEYRTINMMYENRVRGLIIAPFSQSGSRSGSYLSVVQKSGIPIVLLDSEVEGIECDGVFFDNYVGAYDATRLLFQNGHRRIAIIHGSTSFMTERDRLEGYLAAYQSAGIAPNPEWQYEATSLKDAEEAALRLLQLGKGMPNAVFCCSNVITIGCLKTFLAQKIKVPDDIALIGSDEIDPYGIWASNITVLSQPTNELGRMAAHALLTRIRNAQDEISRPTNRIILQPKLLARGSEGPSSGAP